MQRRNEILFFSHRRMGPKISRANSAKGRYPSFEKEKKERRFFLKKNSRGRRLRKREKKKNGGQLLRGEYGNGKSPDAHRKTRFGGILLLDVQPYPLRSGAGRYPRISFHMVEGVSGMRCTQGGGDPCTEQSGYHVGIERWIRTQDGSQELLFVRLECES
jgi:hypothetical protein